MGTLTQTSQAAPSSPVVGDVVLYFKTDNLLYWKDSGGTEHNALDGSTILTRFTNFLSADVLLNNVALYFDGPSVAQGVLGTWRAIGTITLLDSVTATTISVKLWDGTTIIASGAVTIPSVNYVSSISLSGFLSSPAGNIRMSAIDTGSTGGKILFNQSGNSKDSSVSALRIA